MRVSIVLPTFEPAFSSNPELIEFYRRNFDSWLDPEGGHDWSLILSDFQSSTEFKGFLRGYASGRGPRVVLLDGKATLSSTQAINMGLRHQDYDVAVYVASDMRARDRMWLSQLMADFADPDVLAVVPTVTADGAAVLPQTQAASVDRVSMAIRPPKVFQFVSAAFRRRLFEPFGGRIADRFKHMGNDKGLMWQVIAADGTAMLNFRCNLINPSRKQTRPESAYDWDDPTHRDRREARKIESAIAKAAARILPLPGGWFRYSTPWHEALSEGWRENGWYGLARRAWIRWHYIQASYALVMIRENATHMSYIRENLTFGRRQRDFRALDRESRIRLVEALFMGPPAVYEDAKCDVVTSGTQVRAAAVR